MRQAKGAEPIAYTVGPTRSALDSSCRRVAVVVAILAIAGCSATKLPQISYDSNVPLLPASQPYVDDRPRPLHVPPAWTPTRGGKVGTVEATDAVARVEVANAAARVEPRSDGYFNAVQVFPFSPGALYQVYVAPGQITDIALEPGEQLTGAGPIAAGDTVRWIIGDTVGGLVLPREPRRPGAAPLLRRPLFLRLRNGVIDMPLRGTSPRGGRSASMTTVARSTSSSRRVSFKARCHRSSSLARRVDQSWSTTAPMGMCSSSTGCLLRPSSG